jgi:peptide/nickel transport system substrate-binding protein
MEAALTSAQITLPDKAIYPKLDANGAPIPGEVDTSAYGDALKKQLDDLNNTLSAGEADKVAAAFRLLEIQRAPIGTGPYKFGKYTTGQSVTLDANPDYYHPFGGPVGPAHVNIPVIKDAATAAQALQNGDIKWLTEVNSDALTALKADPNLQLSEYADFGYYYIAFNLRDGHPYADKAAREAFTMCIDHDATVTAATDGQGKPIQANTPPASWAYNPAVTPYKLDVAGAKAKLEAAGWALGSDNLYAKGGQKLTTKLYVRQGRPQRVKFAQLAKDQLALCGINIDVAESDFATVLLPLLSYPNKFDTYLGGWSTSIDPDDFSIFHSSHITTKDNKDDNNFPGWKNAEGDKLLEQGRQELDQAKRKDIYFKFQQIIHDDAPYYFLWADQAHRGYSKKVSSTGDPIDFTSPLDYWNNDAWIVAQ